MRGLQTAIWGSVEITFSFCSPHVEELAGYGAVDSSMYWIFVSGNWRLVSTGSLVFCCISFRASLRLPLYIARLPTLNKETTVPVACFRYAE